VKLQGSAPTPADGSVDSPPPLIDRGSPSSRPTDHYRLNGPVALHTRAGVIGRRKYTERRAWTGAPTDHQQRELDDLRRFESAKSCDELPDLRRSISASTLLGLKNAGKAHAYRLSLAQLRVLGLEGDDCYYARAYLAWLLCAQLGHGNDWMIPRHSDMATIIECCETYAARASRELVARGLVRRTPLYGTVKVTTSDGARTYQRHVRGPSAFRVPSSVLERIGIRDLSTGIAGEKYQASEIQPPRVNPDLGGDRERGVIDAPSLRRSRASATTSSLQQPTTDATPTTTGPLAIACEAITTSTSSESDESSSRPSHSASAFEPVALVGAPRGVVVDETPPARSTREAAMFRRTLGEHLDRCQASFDRRLEANLEVVRDENKAERKALEAERERLRYNAARFAADAPRPRAAAPLIDGELADEYAREAERRRRLGLGMPDEKTWLVERRLQRRDDGHDDEATEAAPDVELYELLELDLEDGGDS
jgi:hypothetical protein